MMNTTPNCIIGESPDLWAFAVDALAFLFFAIYVIKLTDKIRIIQQKKFVKRDLVLLPRTLRQTPLITSSKPVCLRRQINLKIRCRDPQLSSAPQLSLLLPTVSIFSFVTLLFNLSSISLDIPTKITTLSNGLIG